MSTAPCPRCGRANAAHRLACLYCGAGMPNPVAAPTRPTRGVPANLDELVRDALRGSGGGVRRVRAALEAGGSEEGAATASPPREGPPREGPPREGPPREVPALEVAAREVPAREVPPREAAPARPSVREVAAPSVREVAAPSVREVAAPAEVRSRTELLDALVLAAERARVALDLGGALDVVAELVAEARRLDGGASTARSSTRPEGLAAPVVAPVAAPVAAPVTAPVADPPVPPPPAILLPPVRFAWLLIVTAGAPAEAIAAALGIDHATARLIAQGTGPRVVGRGDDPAVLEARAQRARDAGIHATVQARSMLSGLPAAETLLGVEADGRWSTCTPPVWLEPPDPSNRPVGTLGALVGVFLVVPGEVEVRDQRGPREPDRWARSRYAVAGPVAERRVAVVDLHLPDRIVRVVEGIVDLRTDPAFVAGSARRTLAAWLDAAPRRWPAARIEARRTCAGGATLTGEDGRQSGSGWPAWEEYSRVSRLHGAR